MPPIPASRSKVVIVWWITCLIWSSVWLVIKLGLRDLPPISFAGLRLVVALVALSPILIARRAMLRRTAGEWRLILATGVILLGVNYAFVFWGAQFISSGLTAVIQAASPAFGVFAAYAIAREPIRRLEVTAIAVGIAGLVIIFGDNINLAGTQALLGSLAVAAGALCVAIAYVFVGARGHDIPPIVLTSGQMFAGAIPLLIAGALLDGNPLHFRWSPIAIFALLYLAIAGSVAGFWLNYWLLKRTSAATLLSMSIVEPLIAVLLGALVLGERLSIRVALGGALILVSAWLILKRKAAAKAS